MISSVSVGIDQYMQSPTYLAIALAHDAEMADDLDRSGPQHVVLFVGQRL
jgi:hypothetical protein